MLRAAPAGYCHIIETREILRKEETEVREQKIAESSFFFNNIIISPLTPFQYLQC